jgi:triphosphoribosyl-dephospho-CoA synthase
MSCLRLSELETLAAALVKGASMELCLTPKPGLVDLADCGSHPDLSVAAMERSIEYVSGYLDEIVASLKNGESFVHQRNIAIRAERRLLENLGTNTHKGFIFLSGMLLIARWHAVSADEGTIRMTLSSLAEGFFRTNIERSTNGQQARKKYNAGGIVRESINGFPSLFDEALPVFRAAIKQHGCPNVASFAMLARLMQTVDDTTTLHRAGPPGLSRVKRDGQQLAQIIAAGGDHVAYLSELNRSYVSMNITIGGVADMLGLSYGFLIASGEISENDRRKLSRELPCSPMNKPIFSADAGLAKIHAGLQASHAESAY